MFHSCHPAGPCLVLPRSKPVLPCSDLHSQVGVAARAGTPQKAGRITPNRSAAEGHCRSGHSKHRQAVQKAGLLTINARMGRQASGQKKVGHTGSGATDACTQRHGMLGLGGCGWVGRVGGVCKGATSGGLPALSPAAAARQQRTAALPLRCAAGLPAKRKAALQAGFKRRPQARLLRSPARLQGGGAEPSTTVSSVQGGRIAAVPQHGREQGWQRRLGRACTSPAHVRHTENGRASTARARLVKSCRREY